MYVKFMSLKALMKAELLHFPSGFTQDSAPWLVSHQNFMMEMMDILPPLKLILMPENQFFPRICVIQNGAVIVRSRKLE